jgi:hypothetical protein
MRRLFIARLFFALILGIIMMLPTIAVAKEQAQQWEVINPAGVVQIKQEQLAPRITTLEGKTIVLRWNGKHNGDNFLDRIAELLKEKVPSAKVIKLYEVDKSTIKISGTMAESARIAQVIKGMGADIVIAAQTD